MADAKSREEMARLYEAEMGPDLGPVFHALSIELTWLNWRWQQHEVLFSDKPERLDLLNETAPFFFYLVQRVFFEDTVLGIARLLDPPASAGKANLTACRLPELVRPELRHELEDRLAAADASGAFAREWRHKHLAHRDLDLALKLAGPPPAVTVAQVREALDAIARVLDHVEHAYCSSTTMYGPAPSAGNAETLLHFLQVGVLRDRDQHEQWDKAEPHEDDVNPPGPV